MRTKTVLLFSDVDDTFRDRGGRFALGARTLRRYSAPVNLVFASSRTVDDLSAMQVALGIDGPLVAENGAVVAFPAPSGAITAARQAGRRWRLDRRGLPRAELQATLVETCGALGMSPEIPNDPARHCSVLFRITDAASTPVGPLLEDLRHQGLSVSFGGEWFALTGGADKGSGVRVVRQELVTAEESWLVAGIGDGENDVPLLWAVDRKFVIQRSDGTWHPDLSSIPGAHLLARPGLAGWRFALRALAGEVAQ